MERPILILISVAAALLSAGLIAVLLPHLRAHALASPNARSSHRVTTPQGGGAGVILATLAVVVLCAKELNAFRGLATSAQMDRNNAKGLGVCHAGGKENCDEQARFHGGHLVGATELGLYRALPQCWRSTKRKALDQSVSC